MEDLPALGMNFSFVEYAESFEAASTVSEQGDAQKPRLDEYYPQVYALVRRALRYFEKRLLQEAPEFPVWREANDTEPLKRLLLARRDLLEIFFVVPFDGIDNQFITSFAECALVRATLRADREMVAMWLSEALILYIIEFPCCVYERRQINTRK